MSDTDPFPKDRLGATLRRMPRYGKLAWRLGRDPVLSRVRRGAVIAAAGYLISPIDAVPGVIPVLGQLDDIYLVALCLLRLMNRSGEAKLRQHWDGPEDIVRVLNTVTDYATRYLPGPVRTAVRGWVEVRTGHEPPGSA